MHLFRAPYDALRQSVTASVPAMFKQALSFTKAVYLLQPLAATALPASAEGSTGSSMVKGSYVVKSE
uniref:Uncharacterized protein n=1 Tax=Peronospora matthiolae TaxID=2874970 RepID=A0AAV1UWG0_9STRA